uniref:Uncharacterized protein n=1 Tax=Cucumis sativus TaxID=3659 RepID=A0A0A0KKM9_CUCSA
MLNVSIPELTHNYEELTDSFVQSLLPISFFFNQKRRNREGLGNSSRSTEGDLTRVLLVNINFRNGNPKEKLLALNSSETAEASLLDEGRDLRVVQDSASNGGEPVLFFLLLLEPNETGGPIVADLKNIV